MESIGIPSSGPHEFTPDLYPSFPPEIQPCIDLKTISLAAIQADDTCEHAQLLSICKDKGFFFLNICDTTAHNLIQDAEAIGHLSEDVFRLPLEEKLRYPWFRKPNSLLG
jgi:isopenicillin N synthase-like dioxygenase